MGTTWNGETAELAILGRDQDGGKAIKKRFRVEANDIRTLFATTAPTYSLSERPFWHPSACLVFKLQSESAQSHKMLWLRPNTKEASLLTFHGHDNSLIATYKSPIHSSFDRGPHQNRPWVWDNKNVWFKTTWIFLMKANHAFVGIKGNASVETAISVEKHTPKRKLFSLKFLTLSKAAVFQYQFFTFQKSHSKATILQHLLTSKIYSTNLVIKSSSFALILNTKFKPDCFVCGDSSSVFSLQRSANHRLEQCEPVYGTLCMARNVVSAVAPHNW